MFRWGHHKTWNLMFHERTNERLNETSKSEKCTKLKETIFRLLVIMPFAMFIVAAINMVK